MIILGAGVLFLGFLVVLVSIAAAAFGVVKKNDSLIETARLAALISFPLLTLAVLALVSLLLSGRFDVQYVYQVTSRAMPDYLKVTALWGGQSGSLLFWAWLMSAFSSAVMLRKWKKDGDLLPWVILVTMVTLGFFIGLVIFIENPFVRWWQTDLGETAALFAPAGALPIVPADGRGLNPLLRHPGMIYHPPMLYLGFVSFVVPYAFAIATLVTGRKDEHWLRVTRHWTLVGWLFLSLGLILGARWAYDVLGWGGYWAWDPVEIAAFMPWLSATAFLHSAMIQEKRGFFKRWNIILIIITYSLVIFGTFLTRSGVLSSVHAFAQSAIGPLFFAFIGITFFISLGLLLQRWGDLHNDGEMGTEISREILLIFGNLLFMGVLVVCLWGVLFPLVSELFTGQKVTVGPPFYERANGPLFLALIILMAAAPLSVWGQSFSKRYLKRLWIPLLVSLLGFALFWFFTDLRNPLGMVSIWVLFASACLVFYFFLFDAIVRARSMGEFFLAAMRDVVSRNRRRYGAHLIHLGIICMGLGVVGIEFFQAETQGMLAQGQSLSLGQYTASYDSMAIFDAEDGHNVARAVISVEKDGRPVGKLYPRRDYYYDAEQPMTIPGVRSTPLDDFYVILVDWLPISSEGATFKVYRNPLVIWLWIGTIVMVLGTLVASWPEREKEIDITALSLFAVQKRD